MSKKTKIISILLLVISIFTLTGCSLTDYFQPKHNKKQKEESKYIKINTEGLGQISYYVDKNEKQDFSDENPKQSATIKIEKEKTITIAAKADEGWKFVKWTKDGIDFSYDSKISVTINKTTEFIAIFENN